MQDIIDAVRELPRRKERSRDSRLPVIVALNRYGRAMVERDMGLIRKIFAEIRGRNSIEPALVEIPETEEWIVARHVEMLLDAGLLEGQRSDRLGIRFPVIFVTDLSMAGHDFAAALSNDGVWSKLKSKLSAPELASIPLTVVKAVSVDLLTVWVKAKVGLS